MWRSFISLNKTEPNGPSPVLALGKCVADQMLQEKNAEGLYHLVELSRGEASSNGERKLWANWNPEIPLPPITPPTSKKVPSYAQGRMRMCLQLAPIQPKPTLTHLAFHFQDRSYLTHTGKSQSNRLCKDNHQKEIEFSFSISVIKRST